MANRDHPLYLTWKGMKTRCYNVNAIGYANYGALGVGVSPEWRFSFDSFVSDVGPKPGPNYSLDRIDPFGNYEKSNCRWASRKTQARNCRTRNRLIEFQGQTKTLAEWSEILGVDRCRIRDRIDKQGWSIEDAFMTPKTHKHLRHKGA